MNRLRPVVASLVTTVVVLGLAAPAMAVSWGTIVVYESGVEQGRAYGTFASQSYTYAAMDAYFKDSRPGGNGVFVDIDYMYWVQDCAQCPACLRPERQRPDWPDHIGGLGRPQPSDVPALGKQQLRPGCDPGV